MNNNGLQDNMTYGVRTASSNDNSMYSVLEPPPPPPHPPTRVPYYQEIVSDGVAETRPVTRPVTADYEELLPYAQPHGSGGKQLHTWTVLNPHAHDLKSVSSCRYSRSISGAL